METTTQPQPDDYLFLEMADRENIDQIRDDILGLYLQAKDSEKEVAILIKLPSPKQVMAIIGWTYTFFEFGRKFFFPDGKFRKPKFREIMRNFRIVLAALKLKNVLVGIFRDPDKAIAKIEKEIQL